MIINKTSAGEVIDGLIENGQCTGDWITAASGVED